MSQFVPGEAPIAKLLKCKAQQDMIEIPMCAMLQSQARVDTSFHGEAGGSQTRGRCQGHSDGLPGHRGRKWP
jgi:hypothetical protein